MINRKSGFVFFLFCLLLFTPYASAHKVNIFAYAEGDTVYTESYFSDGRKVTGGAIEVYDTQKNKLLDGRTDENGQFNFKIPKKDDLKIVLVASMGHKNSYILSKDELPDAVIANKKTKPANAKKENAPEKITGQITPDQIKKMLDASLDQRLKPVMRQLAKAEQKKIYFTEVIGGIGYIFGIAGIALYFLSKKKKN